MVRQHSRAPARWLRRVCASIPLCLGSILEAIIETVCECRVSMQRVATSVQSVYEQRQAANPFAQVWEEARRLRDAFADIDVELVAANMQRVQEAMRRARIGPHHFAGSTGYGHGDLGRAALDEVLTSAVTLLRL